MRDRSNRETTERREKIKNDNQGTDGRKRKGISKPLCHIKHGFPGEKEKEPQCELRPVFQRDRDRILHSKAFRRMKQKTQVFLLPIGDHYRTRLTHTLEVSQNARTIGKALRLNEDLVEAIALGHDLGHTPFGPCRRESSE